MNTYTTMSFVLGTPTTDESWTPVSLTNADEPKYAVLNNKELLMLRDDDFSTRSKRIIELEDLSDIFRQMNVSDHPSIKTMVAAQQKAFEEEHKDEMDADKKEQTPVEHLGGVPDSMITGNLVDGQGPDPENRGGFQDTVMDYISKNFLKDSKPGEEEEEEDLNWHDSDEKEEL